MKGTMCKQQTINLPIYVDSFARKEAMTCKAAMWW